MHIGKINRLKAARTTEFGFFLVDDEGNDVLLPNAYVSDELKLEDEIDVFIYRDSENRVVATTLKPYVEHVPSEKWKVARREGEGRGSVTRV